MISLSRILKWDLGDAENHYSAPGLRTGHGKFTNWSRRGSYFAFCSFKDRYLDGALRHIREVVKVSPQGEEIVLLDPAGEQEKQGHKNDPQQLR